MGGTFTWWGVRAGQPPTTTNTPLNKNSPGANKKPPRNPAKTRRTRTSTKTTPTTFKTTALIWGFLGGRGQSTTSHDWWRTAQQAPQTPRAQPESGHGRSNNTVAPWPKAGQPQQTNNLSHQQPPSHTEFKTKVPSKQDFISPLSGPDFSKGFYFSTSFLRGGGDNIMPTRTAPIASNQAQIFLEQFGIFPGLHRLIQRKSSTSTLNYGLNCYFYRA